VITYVCGFAFQDGRLALIRKKRPDWQKGKLNGIGGHVEPGESPIEAMHREFYEETGGVADWTHFATLTDARGWEVYFYSGPCVVKPMTLTDEEVVWADPAELPDDVIPNLRFLVPMALSPAKDWPFKIIEGSEKDA